MPGLCPVLLWLMSSMPPLPATGGGIRDVHARHQGAVGDCGSLPNVSEPVLAEHPQNSSHEPKHTGHAPAHYLRPAGITRRRRSSAITTTRLTAAILILTNWMLWPLQPLCPGYSNLPPIPKHPTPDFARSWSRLPARQPSLPASPWGAYLQ